MQVQVLGSSSGTPTKQRNVSGYALYREDLKPWYLVDCGEGTQHQILKTRLSIYHLEAVFITHKHGDHCYGLPGLIASAGLSGRTHPMYIIAPEPVLEFIRATMSMTELVLPFELMLLNITELKSVRYTWVKVDSCSLRHRVPSYAFKFTENRIVRKLNIDKLQAEGIASGAHYNRLQQGEDIDYKGRHLCSSDYTYFAWPPRVIMICGDNEAPRCLDSLIDDVDLLVHEATFLAVDLHKVGFHTGHSDVERVAEYAHKKRLNGLLLTHFSARYGGQKCMARIEKVASERFFGALYLAQDGMTVEIDKQGHIKSNNSKFVSD